MTDNIDVFSLLLLISFLWYIFYKNSANQNTSEPFICGRVFNPSHIKISERPVCSDDSCLSEIDGGEYSGQGCPGGGCPLSTAKGGLCSAEAQNSMFYQNGGFISRCDINKSKQQYHNCKKKCEEMKWERGNFADITNRYNQCLVSCCNVQNDNMDVDISKKIHPNAYQRGYQDALRVLDKHKTDESCNVDINYNSDKYYCTDYGSHKAKYGDIVPDKMLVTDKYGVRKYHMLHDSDICCSNAFSPEDNFKKGYTKCCSFYKDSDIIRPKNCEKVKLQ